MKSRITIAILAGSILLGAAWFAVGMDDWMGASLSLAFEGTFIALGVLVGVLTMLCRGRKGMLLLPTAYILFILLLPFANGSPVKPAVRAVHDIRPGMTESEVRAVLERHFPENGRFKRPAFGALQPGVCASHQDVLSFVLDPKDGRYNAAVVWVRFSAGKCLSAGFDPD